MTAIRLKCPLAQAGRRLHPNGERYLRSIGRLSGIHPARHLAATLDIASRCTFSLDEIRYEYPEELVPPSETPTTHLRKLTFEGLARRYPAGAPPAVVQTVEHELELIAELAYEPFFLTVQDIVAFARSQDILCQGRGSAANSAESARPPNTSTRNQPPAERRWFAWRVKRRRAGQRGHCSSRFHLSEEQSVTIRMRGGDAGNAGYVLGKNQSQDLYWR
jgi:hypothetical protein